jgi:hypothetical protein
VGKSIINQPFGNGKHTTNQKMLIEGMVYGIVSPTLPSGKLT